MNGLVTLARAALGVAALWVAVRVFLWWVGGSAVAAALGMPVVEAWALATLGPPTLLLAGLEAAVAVSAVLDWREARLNTVGWRQTWMVAHATVCVRAWRRTRWVYAGARLAVTRWQERRAAVAEAAREAEYVVLDPAAPFDGRVIDQEDQAA